MTFVLVWLIGALATQILAERLGGLPARASEMLWILAIWPVVLLLAVILLWDYRWRFRVQAWLNR